LTLNYLDEDYKFTYKYNAIEWLLVSFQTANYTQLVFYSTVFTKKIRWGSFSPFYLLVALEFVLNIDVLAASPEAPLAPGGRAIRGYRSSKASLLSDIRLRADPLLPLAGPTRRQNLGLPGGILELFHQIRNI